MKKLLHFIFAFFILLPLAQADEVTYFIPDASGSPVAAMNEAGDIIWRKHYQPLGGELDAQVGTHRIGYTGHVKDQTTGLNYMGARYYDPSIGLFMSMDPAAINPNDPRTFNRYNYANNNPYLYVDPDGKMPALAIEGLVILSAGLYIAATNPELTKRMTDSVQAWWGASNENANSTEGSDPVAGVLDGAEPGDKTKGRTTNWDKPGGFDQANTDFDKLVPNGSKPIDDSDDASNGRKGVMDDGRKVNVRPNSSDGRPTLEIQNGKNRTKIRYDD